jgi:magnesium chelatase family protein
MLARSVSAGLAGIDARPVDIEVDIVRGLPGFTIVGLPDATVRESKDRIRSAMENSGFEFPPRNFVVNLAPAFFKKEGSNYDLSIAAAIMLSTGQIIAELPDFPMIGELSLDGTVKPVRGVLSMVLALVKSGRKRVIVPSGNAVEAAAVGGVEVFSVRSLAEIPAVFRGKIPPYESGCGEEDSRIPGRYDFANVYGQESVKRAVEVAAAGHHNLILYGPPGSGKSMIAQTVPSILPRLTRKESIETTMIHSVGGALESGRGLVTVPPFRAPHHTSSDVAMVGGGRYPSVGEISLAHNGVLFMDEFPEFKNQVLQTLRQPLEDRKVTVSRAAGRFTFPADFMLVASANPCLCGNYFESEARCTCSAQDVMKHRKKLSGPVLDRIDIEIYVPRIPYRELMGNVRTERSSDIRERVGNARVVQAKRFGEGAYNATMTSSEVREYCALDREAESFFENASLKMGLSPRSLFRVLKVARTIADLSGGGRVELSHVAEAVSYKSLEAQYRSRAGC